MKVRELLEQLKGVDPEREIVMSKDAEGNGYSPLSSLWEGRYRAETTWYGDVGLEILTAEDRQRGYTDEDVIDDGVPAVILVPTN